MWSLLIVSIPIVMISFFVEKKWYRPVVLFNGVWLIIFVLFLLQLFSTIEIDDRTIGILLVQTVAFPVGALLGSIYSKKYRIRSLINKNNTQEPFSHELRDKLFWILCVITIVVLLKDELQIIIMLFRGSSYREIMRLAGGKNTVEISGAVNVFLYMFIVHPMIGCISPICAVEFFARKEKKYYFLAVNLIIVALAAAHHGGRNAIIQFAFCYLICFFMMGRTIQIPKRVKRMMWVLFAIVFFAFAFLSMSRGIQELGLSSYAYLIASIPLCTIYLSTPVAAVRTWGYTSLKGLFYPLISVLSFFGIKQPEAYKLSVVFKQFTENNYVRIGDYSATGINSFLPSGAFLYMDGGFLFELVGTFLFGFLVQVVYENSKKTGDKKALAITLMFDTGLILSFALFPFSSYQFTIGMMILSLLLYKKKTIS